MKCWRLCREIDRVLGAIRICFVHVLWNVSGFQCGGACFVHVLWNFMVCETADIEICCAPNCSNSSMIWEREIDGEWTFNTSMSSRSSSCNFFRYQASLGFANVCISSQYLYHTDFVVVTVTQLVRKLCKTPWNITRKLVTSFTDNSVSDGAF